MPVNAVRFDNNFASWHAPKDGPSAFTAASMLLVSFKVTDEIAPFARMGWVVNSPPTGYGESPIINPVLGALYGRKLGKDFRIGAALALGLPVGQGGGDSPEPTMTKPPAGALPSGVRARLSMDNVMYGPNDLGIVAGLDGAYIAKGFTAQAEVTVIQAIRVKGEKAQADEMKTNSTFGLHLGYFVLPQVSLGGEIRGQMFLSTPKAITGVEGGEHQFSFGVGPRFHFKLGEGWIRPGIAYSRPIDKPSTNFGTEVIQIDIPVIF